MTCDNCESLKKKLLETEHALGQCFLKYQAMCIVHRDLKTSLQKKELGMKQKVRELAYNKWEKAGYPSGNGIQFWLEAELELGKIKKQS
jgi:hypothetical protein